MNLVILFQADLQYCYALTVKTSDFSRVDFFCSYSGIWSQLNVPKVKPLLDCIVPIKSQRRYWIKTVKYLTFLLASFGF